jgi:DNA relaxase NicK
LLQYALKGEDVALWKGNGYRGWSNGGIRLGARSDGCILSLSSTKCAQHWKEALSASENCSRLDLAVDVDLDPVVLSLARDVYVNVGHVPLRAGRPVKRTLIVSSDGGSTAYIGSRVSELYARCYDKGVEQRAAPPGKWWRLEVEIKGDRAAAVAAQMQQSVAPAQQSLALVADFFESRAALRLPSSNTMTFAKGRLEPSTVDAKLLWLSRGVRPTVQMLIERVGPARVAQALGFPQSVVASLQSFLNSEADHGGSHR